MSLAPYARGWEKLMAAISAKVEQLSDSELSALVEECRAARANPKQASTSESFVSVEVERAARVQLNKRSAPK